MLQEIAAQVCIKCTCLYKNYIKNHLCNSLIMLDYLYVVSDTPGSLLSISLSEQTVLNCVVSMRGKKYRRVYLGKKPPV